MTNIMCGRIYIALALPEKKVKQVVSISPLYPWHTSATASATAVSYSGTISSAEVSTLLSVIAAEDVQEPVLIPPFCYCNLLI